MSRATGPDCCLAVDVGGTKMAVGLVDAAGRLRWSARLATPPGAAADVLFATLAELLDRAAVDPASGRPVVCGIGCGGPMTDGELVSPLNIPGWLDFPLRRRVAEHTGLPTAMDNDAKALALGEGWQGAARGAHHYMAMVVSTGIGGGIVLDGQLLDGATGNAGHVGHVVVVPGGRPCACGGRGCLEAEASGGAIAARTGHPASEAPVALRRRVGTLVGRGVASVVNLLDLPLVLVAGSVALGYGQHFFDAATAELRARSTISYAVGARLVPAGRGADAPLVGAAAVGWRAAGLAVTGVGG